MGKNKQYHNTCNVGVPATKDQRDLLFQKMKEAGYEWNSEKKELVKIEQTPAWSEEDEKVLEKIISDYTAASKSFCGHQGKLDWLKFLRERVLPQPKKDWSEEDEKTLNIIVEKGDLKPSEIQWLKSLRERYTWKPTDEQIEVLGKEGRSQVIKDIEYVYIIDDACDKRYSEEYAHGEYCHEQSFRWGFQEGVDWLEKQGGQSKQHLYDIITALWDLLDKIDKFSDLQIDDANSDNPFRKIEHITQERHKFVKSDGYNLFIENFMITNDKNFEKQGEQKCDCKYVGCHVNDVKRWCHKKQAEIPYEKCNTKCSEYLKCSEQKPTDGNVEPKFNVGDKIIEKDPDECSCGTIVNIKDGKYIFDNGCFIYIKEQDLWQLVKRNPDNKVEPKFKVGDWVRAISSGNIFKIISVNDGLYRVLCYDGVEANYPIEDVEKDLVYWTIQDAKDGDVLKEDSCIFIIERMKTNGTAIVHCCLFDDGDFDSGSNLSFDIDSTYPATKEQRDLLFFKMKEAGYELDAEKKELKKIEQTLTWNENDERILHEISQCVYDNVFNIGTVNKVRYIDWLKSIERRIKS